MSFIRLKLASLFRETRSAVVNVLIISYEFVYWGVDESSGVWNCTCGSQPTTNMHDLNCFSSCNCTLGNSSCNNNYNITLLPDFRTDNSTEQPNSVH